MINIKQKQILVFLFVSALLVNCSESENPIVNKDEKQMELEIIPANKVIIKLNKPDSLIFNYGFQNNDGGIPIGCFFTWRHYKYSNK